MIIQHSLNVQTKTISDFFPSSLGNIIGNGEPLKIFEVLFQQDQLVCPKLPWKRLRQLRFFEVRICWSVSYRFVGQDPAKSNMASGYPQSLRVANPPCFGGLSMFPALGFPHMGPPYPLGSSIGTCPAVLWTFTGLHNASVAGIFLGGHAAAAIFGRPVGVGTSKEWFDPQKCGGSQQESVSLPKNGGNYVFILSKQLPTASQSYKLTNYSAARNIEVMAWKRYPSEWFQGLSGGDWADNCRLPAWKPSTNFRKNPTASVETVLQPVKNNSMNPLCLVPFQVEMFSNMAASPKIDDGWNLHWLEGIPKS